MRIDAARNQQTTLGVNDAHATGNHEIGARSDVLDLAILHVDVGGHDAVVVHHLALLDVQTVLGALWVVVVVGGKGVGWMENL